MADDRYRVRAFQGLKTTYSHDTDDRKEALDEAEFAVRAYPRSEVSVFDTEERDYIFRHKPETKDG